MMSQPEAAGAQVDPCVGDVLFRELPASLGDTGPAGAVAPRPDPVVDLFDRRVTALDLCSTPCTVARDASAGEARDRLAVCGHRYAPLAGAGPVEVVDLAELEAAADDVPVWVLAHAVGRGGRARPWAGLPELLLKLRHHPMVVIVGEVDKDASPVVGVVTRHDLRRPAVGIAVLGLVLRSEPRLDLLIDQWSRGRWADLVPPGRRAKAEALGEAVAPICSSRGPMSALNLDDRMTLVRKLPELRAALGWPSTATFRRFAERLCRTRDALAHGADLLASVERPEDALALALRLRQLVDAIDDLLRLPPGP